jgi:hypothetical protein
VTFDPPTGERAELLGRSEEGRRLSIGIGGSDGTRAVLELERAQPFSVTEARLAALLGGTAGQAAEGRPIGHGAHI